MEWYRCLHCYTGGYAIDWFSRKFHLPLKSAVEFICCLSDTFNSSFDGSAPLTKFGHLSYETAKLVDAYQERQEVLNTLGYDFSSRSLFDICLNYKFNIPSDVELLSQVIMSGDRAVFNSLYFPGASWLTNRSVEIPTLVRQMYKGTHKSVPITVLPLFDVPGKLSGAVLIRQTKGEKPFIFSKSFPSLVPDDCLTSSGMTMPPFFEQNRRKTALFIHDPIIATKMVLDTWGVVHEYKHVAPVFGVIARQNVPYKLLDTTNFSFVEQKDKVFWDYDQTHTGLRLGIKNDAKVYMQQFDNWGGPAHFSGDWGDSKMIEYIADRSSEEVYWRAVGYAVPWEDAVIRYLREYPVGEWSARLSALDVYVDTPQFQRLKELFSKEFAVAKRSTSFVSFVCDDYLEKEDGLYHIKDGRVLKLFPMYFRLNSVTNFGPDIGCYGFIDIHVNKQVFRGKINVNNRLRVKSAIKRILAENGVPWTHVLNNIGVDRLMEAHNALHGICIDKFREKLGISPVGNCLTFQDFKVKKGKIELTNPIPLPGKYYFGGISCTKHGNFNLDDVEILKKTAYTNDILSVISLVAGYVATVSNVLKKKHGSHADTLVIGKSNNYAFVEKWLRYINIKRKTGQIKCINWPILVDFIDACRTRVYNNINRNPKIFKGDSYSLVRLACATNFSVIPPLNIPHFDYHEEPLLRAMTMCFIEGVRWYQCFENSEDTLSKAARRIFYYLAYTIKHENSVMFKSFSCEDKDMAGLLVLRGISKDKVLGANIQTRRNTKTNIISINKHQVFDELDKESHTDRYFSRVVAVNVINSSSWVKSGRIGKLYVWNIDFDKVKKADKLLKVIKFEG